MSKAQLYSLSKEDLCGLKSTLKLLEQIRFDQRSCPLMNKLQEKKNGIKK